MITIDVSSIDQEFIDWKAIIQRSMTGEKVSVQKAGKEVLQILPSDDAINGISRPWSNALKEMEPWDDFPSLEEIRSGYGEDVPRESL